MGSGSMQLAVAALRAAHDELAALPVDALTRPELLGVLDEVETLTCQLPAHGHRLLARLQAETTPKELGAKSWRDVLAIRWRISTSEAGRRLEEAATLGPRRALTGEPLEPVLPYTAVAQAQGVINREHVKVIREAMNGIPSAIDATTRAQIESDLVRTAIGVGPKPLKDTADRTLFLLDQDGPEPNDTERARRRGVTMAPQQRGGNSQLNGNLTPEARAIYEAIWAKWAAPGMCNPDEERPCVSGTPSQAQIDNDHRTLAQRQHDALIAVGRSVLESGELGQHNGLPTSIIIRTTLQDLESRAGVGVTGGGTAIPISTVIRLGAHANHYLAVFDGATGSALDLFRARRVASPAQRIMLIARDGGCTKPCCTVPAYGSQVHHAARDWADDGQTNVDDLGLACGHDNRMVGPGGWATRMNARHEVEWIPPESLDTGQARVNNYHRPERLLRPPDDPPANGDNKTQSAAQCDKEGQDLAGGPEDHQPGGPEPNAA
ncbi:MAG TPA: 13E12 repeat family protein [Mycobacterium sp.]|nr:13E12 repeat family protein [Mycobacterium sp.]